MSDLAPLAQAATLAEAYRARTLANPTSAPLPYATLAEAFAAPLPESGTPGPETIQTLARLAEPGLHATTGTGFFGWVIGASHPVGVAADWLTSAWGQNAGNHTASPAAAAAETTAERWLLELLDLPRESSIGFVTGATMANIVCLAAARGAVLRRIGHDPDAHGLFGAPPIQVVIGDDAHSTVFSALQFLGLGHDRVHRVATDDQGRMRADDFARIIAPLSGPIIACMQAGQLNTGAFDPAEIIALAHAKGAWVHIDGAFGLWARACPTRAHLAAGLDQADSWATDGHKWLQTPYDCGYAIVRDADSHRRAMTIAASYLPTVQAGERDPSHTVPELSRRARGFATWAMIQHLGRAGIAEMVERHCRLAARMAATLAAVPGITVANQVVLNQVILRFGDSDAATQATVARLQADGTIFAGAARWRGQWVLRLSVIAYPFDEQAADRATAAISRAWQSVQQGSPT
jgi:glutamate/tyrosine decarboxylase-like PLP-dependent enzyme